MKKFVCVALFALAMLLAICLISCSKDGEKDLGSAETLYVYNWGEYISDGSEGSMDVNAAFEKYCREELGRNVKVNYSTFSSNEDMYAKISSGAVAYDVIIPSDYMIERMINENLLQPLDMDKIPNYENIAEEFKGENVYYEPKNENGDIYSVPYNCGLIGIIYNTEIVSEDENGFGSWELMFDPNTAHRGDILQYNNSRDAFGTAQYYRGYDVNSTNTEEWLDALNLLKGQKEIVQGYVMDEIFNKMQSGSAAIASYYAGDFLTMYGVNDALDFYYPKEGTNIFVDAMCVPYNAPSADLAMEYINFMASEEVAVENAEYICYASPNAKVRENEDYQTYMTEEIHPRALEILYGYQAQYDEAGVELIPYKNLSPEQLDMLNGLWEELKVESSIGNGIYICCGVILVGLASFIGYEIYKKRRWAKLYD